MTEKAHMAIPTTTQKQAQTKIIISHTIVLSQSLLCLTDAPTARQPLDQG